MSDLNLTIEEENLEKIIEGFKKPETAECKEEQIEDMDTHGDVLLK